MCPLFRLPNFPWSAKVVNKEAPKVQNMVTDEAEILRKRAHHSFTSS